MPFSFSPSCLNVAFSVEKLGTGFSFVAPSYDDPHEVRRDNRAQWNKGKKKGSRCDVSQRTKKGSRQAALSSKMFYRSVAREKRNEGERQATANEPLTHAEAT